MKYGAIVTTTVHHEGDERSRTNPGHGYPAYDEHIETLKTFENQDDLKRWLKAHGDVSKVRVIEYQELQVKTELVVELKRPGVTRSS